MWLNDVWSIRLIWIRVRLRFRIRFSGRIRLSGSCRLCLFPRIGLRSGLHSRERQLKLIEDRVHPINNGHQLLLLRFRLLGQRIRLIERIDRTSQLLESLIHQRADSGHVVRGGLGEPLSRSLLIDGVERLVQRFQSAQRLRQLQRLDMRRTIRFTHSIDKIGQRTGGSCITHSLCCSIGLNRMEQGFCRLLSLLTSCF